MHRPFSSEGCPFQRLLNIERSYREGKKNVYGKSDLWKFPPKPCISRMTRCHLWRFMNTIYEVYLWKIHSPVHLLIPLIHRHLHIFLFLLPSFRLYCFCYTFFQIPWLVCKAGFKDKLTIPNIYEECVIL